MAAPPLAQPFDRRTLMAGLSLGAAALALPASAQRRAAPPCPIATPLAAMADRLLAQSPETATYNGISQALDGGPLARRLDDYSPDGEARWREALAAALAEADRLSCGSDALAALRLEVIRHVLANGTRSADISYGRINAFSFSGHVPYLVTQVAGPHIDSVNLMQTQQSLATPAAVDAWLEKLDGFGAAFDGVIEKIRADEAAGCRPPCVLLRKALPVIDSFLAGPSHAHPLVAALRERMLAAGLDPRARASAEARATALLDRRARPAFARLREAVADLARGGREEAGLWAQPRGEALYAANVRSLGDTAMDPRAIHRLGLEEVRRISAEMDALLRAGGRRTGSVGARMAALAADPRQRFADSPEGHEALLAYVRDIVRQAEARYAEMLPAATIPRNALEVRRVPEATEDGAPGGFYDGPSLDGSRPGTFWINLRDMAAVARFRLPTLSIHEGVPGHHTQSSIALSLGEAPLLIRIASFNAYQEGWALYAERLAAEMGFYRSDRWGNLGRLQDELFRAVRLVVDTGLHHERWSREKGIAYMRTATGVAESRVIAEVERYMAWPAQALGYKLGQMRLLALRDAFRRRRGRRYDIRLFHAAVLGNGAMPFDLLERVLLEEPPSSRPT